MPFRKMKAEDLGHYGGLRSVKPEASGFFRVETQKHQWFVQKVGKDLEYLVMNTQGRRRATAIAANVGQGTGILFGFAGFSSTRSSCSSASSFT